MAPFGRLLPTETLSISLRAFSLASCPTPNTAAAYDAFDYGVLKVLCIDYLNNSACMLLARAPTCARPGCGQAASIGARAHGSTAAHVPVCSERCGYELIGPKRGADDDVDAADERDAAHQQMLVQRQEEKRRFDDMAKMTAIMQELINLRARLPEMTELEVSTATMGIGRRISPGGSGMAQRIDAIILDAHVVIGHIIRNETYDMTIVRQRLATLREDIAANATLDAFDATDVGRAAKKAGVSDDVRQMAAYTRFPVQTIATFTLDGVGSYDTLFCIEETGHIASMNLLEFSYSDRFAVYRKDGTKISNSTDLLPLVKQYHKLYENGISLIGSAKNIWHIDWNSPRAQKTIWGMSNGERLDISIIDQFRYKFIANGAHFALIKQVETNPNGGYYDYWRSGVEFRGEKVSWPYHSNSTYHPNTVTIDAGGNVWVADAKNLRVFTANGDFISSIDIPYNVGINADADGNVWLISARSWYRTFTNFRLVPATQYRA